MKWTWRRLLLFAVGVWVCFFFLAGCSTGGGVRYEACVVLGAEELQGRPALFMACREVPKSEIGRR